MFDNKDAYEDLDTRGKRFSNHTYSIVEPGSQTRLQVKMVDKIQKTVSSDASHIYFVLEPGSNKVLPVFQNTVEGKSRLEMKEDHTYFVLQPIEESGNTQSAIPYAVNDVEDHAYFVLEKH